MSEQEGHTLSEWRSTEMRRPFRGGEFVIDQRDPQKWGAKIETETEILWAFAADPRAAVAALSAQIRERAGAFDEGTEAVDVAQIPSGWSGPWIATGLRALADEIEAMPLPPDLE